MKAVLLAGGQSFRLRPITETRPKSMVNVLNQPIMERILENLPEELEHIYVACYYKTEVIEDFFRKNKKRFPNVTIIREERPLGTAGSVKSLEKELAGTFLVLQADVLSSVDIRKMIDSHRENKACVSVSLFKVQDPTAYGIVGVDDEGRIVKFLEKPKSDQVFSTLINAGTYICEPAIFEQIPHYGYCDFANDVFPRLLRRGDKLLGYEFKGFWMDVGTFDMYLEAHKQLLGRSMTFSVESKTKKARVIPPVLIGKNCKIGKAIIGPNVCIADDTVIGDHCKIFDSVIYEKTKLGKGSLIRSSVICARNVIGENAVVEESILADDVRVFSRVKIDRGARIWPRQKIKKDVNEKRFVGAPEDFRL